MNFIRSIFTYSSFSLTEKGILFILIPILTFFLTPADYGILANVEVCLGILLIGTILGTDIALTVDYFKRDQDDFNQVFYCGIIGVLINFLSIWLLIILIGHAIENLTGIPYKWLLVLPLIAFLRGLFRMQLSYYQVRKKATRFGQFSLLHSILIAGISLILIVIFRYDYTGQLWAFLGAALVVGIFAIASFKKEGFLSQKFSGTLFKGLFLFGLPLIPNRLGHLVINFSDRFFITAMEGIDQVGIYHLGYTIGAVVYLFNNAYEKAWTPFLFELLENRAPGSLSKIVTVSTGYVTTVLLICVSLTILAPWIFKIFIDEDFANGVQYVGLVAFAYFFLAVFQVFAQIILYLKKTRIFLFLGMMNIGLNLLLNYFFISAYGTVGAAYATLVSFVVFALCTAVYSHRIFPLPWWSTMLGWISKRD